MWKIYYAEQRGMGIFESKQRPAHKIKLESYSKLIFKVGYVELVGGGGGDLNTMHESPPPPPGRSKNKMKNMTF